MSGIFAQRGAQRLLERVGVLTDLALIDQALLVRVHELDRIFDGDDVIFAGAIDVVDERGQRGRFAGAGGAGDQHQALGQVAEAEQLFGQVQVVGREDLAGNDAHDRAHAAQIDEQVGAKARLAR